ncbi:MAG: Crp/Fnr family transcriptional regulator [Rhodobiaceae bacterium]|nr:Crp/Fnr family transcriptional regulator [Rhodobiaceae bacterium]
MSGPLAIIFSDGQPSEIAAGEYLFHRDDPVRWMFLVLEGEIRLLRYQENGDPVILQRASDKEIPAEASLFSDRYHCDAIAAAQSRVLAIPKAAFHQRLKDDPELYNAWAARLAREVQRARQRSEILTLKTVSLRLDAWLTWNSELPPKGAWLRLAQEIGVSPEALYREIAKRRKRQ